MTEGYMTVKDTVEMIEKAIPLKLQEEWDNSGLQIGFNEAKVETIFVCLELIPENVSEAIDRGADLIVTHHPLIFGSVRNVKDSDPLGEMIIELVKKGISVYSSHTPFDKVNGGNNDALAGLIGLKKVTDLAGNGVPAADKMVGNPSEMHIGRIGEMKKALPFSQVIDLVCEELNLTPGQIRAVGNLDRKIKKVGICTGAGAEYAPLAAESGCQLFITGDLKYHQAQDAKVAGICVLDAGHYGTEKIFPAVMKVQLEKILGNQVEILTSNVNIDPFVAL